MVTSMRYEVRSLPENVQRILPREHLAAALRAPENAAPAVRALAAGWRAVAGEDDAALVQIGLRYFRENNFVYSLSPGTYRSDQLEEFLFRRRIGFCEHFAGAFASLMRLAKVPARVVVGYHGGEYNPLGQYVRVSQADAHAWCEVWLKGVGWQRVDPTSATAPDRINSGMASYLESRGGEGGASGRQASERFGWRRAWRETRMLWDTLAYQWDLRVMNYDQENQLAFFAALGLERIGDGGRLTLVIASLCLVVAALAAWLRRSGRRRVRDPAARAYAQFCNALAAIGLRREPWEGPGRFAARAASEFPAHAGRIHRVGELYSNLRYAISPPPVAELLQEINALVRMLKKRQTATLPKVAKVASDTRASS